MKDRSANKRGQKWRQRIGYALTDTEENDDRLLEEHQERPNEGNLHSFCEGGFLQFFKCAITSVARIFAELLGFATEQNRGKGLGDK